MPRLSGFGFVSGLTLISEKSRAKVLMPECIKREKESKVFTRGQEKVFANGRIISGLVFNKR
jgi:hypothetical protein